MIQFKIVTSENAISMSITDIIIKGKDINFGLTEKTGDK